MAIVKFHTVKSFVQFLWNWLLSGGKLVDQNTANLRAQICSGCHNNTVEGEIGRGCSTCNKLGTTTLDLIRGKIIGKNKTTTGSLKACGICGCDLKISVWIPNVILVSVEDVNAYPSFCWKKKRTENLDV